MPVRLAREGAAAQALIALDSAACVAVTGGALIARLPFWAGRPA
jgi:hypothetical protein